MPNPPIAKAVDGYYHPASENDVIELVKYARDNGLKIRARGATHSVAWSIYTDHEHGELRNDTLVDDPPKSENINLALDQMNGVEWSDKTPGLVEVEAGCHIGKNPYDPFENSTLENSFAYQAFKKGWALDILGGITHQTVSGFTGTGSAGGSVKYGYDNIVAFRVVDGNGEARWIEQGDYEFPAMLTSIGLMGIITKMRFQLVPMYNIRGKQITTSTFLKPRNRKDPACPINLYGVEGSDAPLLQDYLKDKEYCRMTWWPQQGAERIQIWEAHRCDKKLDPKCYDDDKLVPYEEFPLNFGGRTEAYFAALIFVLAGNTDWSRIQRIIARNGIRYRSLVRDLGGKGLTAIGHTIGAIAVSIVGRIVAAIVGLFPSLIQTLFSRMLPAFDAMDTDPLRFHDYYWRSLCMDNTADDVLLCTEFCEIWIPLQYSERAMSVIQTMFDTKGSEAIGWYAQEVYAAKPSSAWINPSYSDGNDEYKEGVFRLDVYWYRDNPDYPNGPKGFFRQYWDTLRAEGVPFRMHWGKYIPDYEHENWAQYYREGLPKFDEFMALREKRDPKNVFFTHYWQQRLLGKVFD